MYYELITSEPFKCTIFSTLLGAKTYVMALHHDAPSVIRHRINDRTIRITTYVPGFGFRTETVKEIHKRLLNNKD